MQMTEALVGGLGSKAPWS